MLFPTFSCLRIIVGVIDISCVNLSGVVTPLVLGQFLAAKYGSIRWFFTQWNQGQSHRVRPYVLFCSFGFNHSFWYRFVCRCATDPVDLSPYVERVPPLARVPEFIYIYIGGGPRVQCVQLPQEFSKLDIKTLDTLDIFCWTYWTYWTFLRRIFRFCVSVFSYIYNYSTEIQYPLSMTGGTRFLL